MNEEESNQEKIPDPNCSICHGTGFDYVGDPTGQSRVLEVLECLCLHEKS